jgi:predicted phage terminase large subunit-like protein
MNEITDTSNLAQLARNEALRCDFGNFIKKCFRTINPSTSFLDNWHLDLIAEYLNACQRREIRRLIINMPPRALKSVCVSVAWPAFLLGHNPSERIMTASYAAGLSVKHALDCRRVLQAAWYADVFPDTVLAHDQNEKHKFATTAFGHRIATSVGGTATGEGGDFLIMDDPQNPAQVMSDTQRVYAAEWFDHTFSTRLDDKRRGVIVLVMQRLHEADLSGHLLAKGGWEHLKLPAIADETQLYSMGNVQKHYNCGELLHPVREGNEQIEAIKKELGSYAFAAQYQQNPMPADAGMVKRHWFERYDNSVLQPFERVVQSWDTAIKAGSMHDCSVCVTIGELNAVHYVMDVLMLRVEYPELKHTVIRYAQRWNADVCLIEDKASGQNLLQDLRREKHMPPLIAILPKQDKITRFAAVSAMIEAGQVALPKEASWLPEFEREILAFPQAKHDDQVDAFSQYLGWVRKRNTAEYRIRGL